MSALPINIDVLDSHPMSVTITMYNEGKLTIIFWQVCLTLWKSYGHTVPKNPLETTQRRAAVLTNMIHHFK